MANVTDRTPEPSGPTLVTGGNGYLPSPPGPRGRRIRHLRARIRSFPGFLESLHAQYGAIASYRLLSRQFCAVFDPDLIREILVAKRHSFAKTVAYRDIRRVEAVSPKPARINSTGVYRISEGLALRVRERRRA